MDSGAAEASARFGDNMRRLRESQGISQEAFAQKAGIHRTYVGNLERGKHSPTLETILLVARALNVPVRDLLAGVE
jgi:transcriptional regulator with XRE-family HTH domain